MPRVPVLRAGDEGLGLRVGPRRRQQHRRLQRLLRGGQQRRVVGVHTRLLSLHGDTPWEAQLEAFRSFDLLITAHGSHLVNLLYSRRHTAVIEMQPLHIDGTLTVAAGVSAARSFLTCRLKFSRDASAVVGSGVSSSFSMRASMLRICQKLVKGL